MCEIKSQFCALLIAMITFAAPEMGKPVLAQVDTRLVNGRVVNSINQAPESGVLVRLWNQDGANMTDTTDINGRYDFQLEASAPTEKSTFLLYHKLGYLTQIMEIARARQAHYEIQLKKAIFAPENIQLLGQVAKQGQPEARIAGAAVYADGGVYRVNTNQSGFFQLPISLEPTANETILWIEAENYQPKIELQTGLRERDQAQILLFDLAPSSNIYTYQFNVIRSDTKRPLAGVEIRINDIAFDRKTDENGLFSTSFFPERSRNAVNAVVFSHPQFPSLRKEYSAGLFRVEETISLQPPTFNITPLVYYQAEDGSLQPIPEVKYYILQKDLAPREISRGPRLVFQALVDDTLRARIEPTAGNGLERFRARTKDFRLFNGMTNLYWQVEKIPLTVKIKIDSSDGYEREQDLELYLVQDEEWFKAERKDGNSFEIKSNRLDSLSRSSWQFRVVSSRYEPIPKVIDFDWYTYTETIRLKERASARKSSEEYPGKGIIRVETKPAAAEISLEGIPVQKKKLSPDTLELPAGRYSLGIKKGGYVPYYRVVDVQRDSTIDLKVDLGDPVTPLARRTRIKVAAEIGILGWYLRYPAQKDGAFPTLRAGGHLLYRLSPPFGVKFSYLASKVPTYYLDQIFAAGVFVGDKRLHASLEFRESTFEASKEVIAKFDGRSLQGNLWLCLGTRDEAAERLAFLEHYPRAILLGYETAFNTINKTVSGSLPREQELSIGILFRAGRGFFEGRGGFILDEVAVINEKRNVRQDANIARFSIRYFYFLN